MSQTFLYRRVGGKGRPLTLNRLDEVRGEIRPTNEFIPMTLWQDAMPLLHAKHPGARIGQTGDIYKVVCDD